MMQALHDDDHGTLGFVIEALKDFSIEPRVDVVPAGGIVNKVTRERGHISEDDVRAVKLAGYDDAQVIEIVLHVALNTCTNYINEVAKTDIDFPVVTARKAA